MMKRLLALDDRCTSRLRLSHSKRLSWYTAAFLSHSGDPWFWIIGIGLALFADHLGWARQGLLLEIGILILGLSVVTLKYIFRRSRPPGEWGKIYRTTDPHSFPSGHAARAALLTVMSLVLGPTWFGLLILLWAPFASLARVMTGVHYLSDIIAGSIVGLLVGGFVLLTQSFWLRMLMNVVQIFLAWSPLN